MTSLQQLRSRIKSVTSTKKITKVMQMVSSAKLRRAKKMMVESSFYTENVFKLVHLMLHNYIIHKVDNLTKIEQKVFGVTTNEFSKRVNLLIIITSDRGLCGGFNNGLLRIVVPHIKEILHSDNQVKLIVVGKKGYDFLKRLYEDSINSRYLITNTDLSSIVCSITEKVYEILMNDNLANCRIYYNSGVADIFFKDIFPIPTDNLEKLESYELEGVSLLDEVIKLYIKGQLCNAIQSSKASEEFSRVMAMDSATMNAGKMIDTLTLLLNRTRQANITKELTEIISGAQAV